MQANPEPKLSMQPKLDDCRRVQPACAPQPDPAPRTFLSEWRKILSGLVTK
jgi:hypothetical protein